MRNFMLPSALSHIIASSLLILILVNCTDSALGQDSFEADMDYAVFFNKDTGPYIEIYYGFNSSALVVVEKEDTARGEALVAVSITKGDSFLVNDLWRMPVEPKQSTKDSKVVDMVRYEIEPGEYKLKFYVMDVYERSKGDSISVSLKVDSNKEKDMFLSDIELASNIKKPNKEEKSNFIKNTLEVIPNPSSLYGEERPVLFFYVEAYNLLSGLQGDKYRTHSWVTDNENNEVSDCPSIERTRTRKFDASVEVGTLNISSLTSGFYNFNFAVKEGEDDTLAMRSKRFLVYNKSEIAERRKASEATAPGSQENEFTFMDIKELDQEFEFMQYLLNDDGKKFYKSLETADAKRSFIYSFWKSSDPDPKTAVSENRSDYFARVAFANEKYGRKRKAGWKTDRGRVYLIYGEPNDIDRFPSASSTYPYEIWNYDRYEGGVYFVFVDATGFNEYVLVHSTATGEVQDVNWLENRARALRVN